MKTLPNGATELQRKNGFVLAAWERGSKTEYVTWAIHEGDDSTYWGHYFPNLDEAAADLTLRATGRAL